MKQFQNKVAVITGAASGIGREIALQAADLGMRLVLADIDANRLAEFSTILLRKGVPVHAVACDVSQLSQVQHLAQETMRVYGKVHLLFNNAGVGTGGLIWEHTVADWEWVLGANLWGVIHGVSTFVPLMLEQCRLDPAYGAHLVNTASVAGLINSPNLGIYNVSKHAAVSYSETLYHDLKLIDAAIGVSALCPYFVATDIHASDKNRLRDHSSTTKTASQRASRQMIHAAMRQATLSAADIATACFEGIRNEQFYIFPHPFVKDRVVEQAADVKAGRNPADPLASVPEVQNFLKNAVQTRVVQTNLQPAMMTALEVKLGDWDLLSEVAKPIRTAVFIEEQNIPPLLEWDEMDAVSLHALAYDGQSRALGTGRLLPDGHIGRMAVHANARGSGVGTAILRALIAEARLRGHQIVRLNAQLVAKDFYVREGFIAYGDVFDDAGIPHIAMQREL